MAVVGAEVAKRRPSKSVHRIKFDVIAQSKLGPFSDHFPHYAGGVVRSDPGGFVMSQEFGRNAHEFFYFQPRKDDVWILTFPKCGNSLILIPFIRTKILSLLFWDIYKGTTWTQELVWMVVNNCNAEAARNNPLFIRSPFLESV